MTSKFSTYLATDRLPSWLPLHHFNEPSYNYKTGMDLINWKEPSFWAFVGMVMFNPTFWNTVAQNGESTRICKPSAGKLGGTDEDTDPEYHNKTITKTIRSPLVGCYLLAMTIFSLSAFRDTLYV